MSHPRPIRALVAIAGCVLAVLLLPASAGAQTPCPTGSELPAPPKGADCTTVQVPLDHSGRVAGTLDIAVARIPAAAARTGTLVVLTGGPGEPAVPLAGLMGKLLAQAAPSHDLVFVDQRGTGQSGAVECEPVTSPESVAACAEKLGERRAFWTTRETALDLEDVRTALGADKLTLLGISYGAKVAGEYARRFPARTAGVVLDSPAPVDGLDTTQALRSLGLPRVLREICFPPGCKAFVSDPSVAMRALVRRLGRSPLRGRIVSPTGRTRPGGLTVDDLYALVALSDLDPFLRAELPAAVASGVLGDAQPLLRLAAAASGAAEKQLVNEARLLATSCVEGRLPWSPDAPLAGRAEALAAAFANAPAARWAPFPRETVLDASVATACAVWPPTPRPEGVQTQGPDVPVLVLSGRDDLRTPLEDARRTASQYPNARVLPVPGVGHSVLGSDLSECAATGLAAFLAGGTIAPCDREKAIAIPRAPFVPASLAALRPAPKMRGAAGRTTTAVAITLLEFARLVTLIDPTESATARIPGLRGGNVTVTKDKVTFRAFEIVRGVRVSGSIRGDEGSLTVTAPGGITGVLTFREGAPIRGTIGGVPAELEDLG